MDTGCVTLDVRGIRSPTKATPTTRTTATVIPTQTPVLEAGAVCAFAAGAITGTGAFTARHTIQTANKSINAAVINVNNITRPVWFSMKILAIGESGLKSPPLRIHALIGWLTNHHPQPTITSTSNRGK